LLAPLTAYARVADDKASHDRLTAAATGFLEKYVQSLGGSAAGGSSGGVGGAGGNALGEWELLEPRTSHRFIMVSEGKFETCVEWLDGMAPGATMRWVTVPGKSDGLTWRIPSEASVVGKTLKIATDSVAQRSFTVEALMRKRDVATGEEGGGDGAAGNGTTGNGATGNGGGGNGGGGNGGGSGVDPSERLAGWKLIDETVHTFSKASDGSFSCNVAWKPAFKADTQLWFPTAPGTVYGIQFKTPADSTRVGHPITVTTASTAPHGFNVSGLYKKMSTVLPSVDKEVVIAKLGEIAAVEA
jgi:hypothetical protein